MASAAGDIKRTIEITKDGIKKYTVTITLEQGVPNPGFVLHINPMEGVRNRLGKILRPTGFSISYLDIPKEEIKNKFKQDVLGNLAKALNRIYDKRNDEYREHVRSVMSAIDEMFASPDYSLPEYPELETNNDYSNSDNNENNNSDNNSRYNNNRRAGTKRGRTNIGTISEAKKPRRGGRRHTSRKSKHKTRKVRRVRRS